MTDQVPPPPQDEDENEVLRAAREQQAQKAAKGGRKIGWKTAAGIGVGSAAVLAALLYANRDKIK
jgi:2-methylcitrate dehydratase PrpD